MSARGIGRQKNGGLLKAAKEKIKPKD